MEIIASIYEKYLQSSGICTDTRKIAHNNIFFALRGDNFNGNDYVETALENGALLCVCDDEKWKNTQSCVYVENALKALQDLALWHRKQFKGKVLAITGTNGKTTTKELAVNVLKEKFKLHFTSGNLNNHIGVPLTILQASLKEEIWVIEMGASKIGDIKELVEIALPNFGMITNCGKAHLEGFGSAENIKIAKGELYDFLKKNNGVIFYNMDLPYLKTMVGEYRNVITLGFSGNATYNFRTLPQQIKTAIQYENEILKSNLFGDYNAMNIAAAACFGLHFGMKTSEIQAGLNHYYPSNNRSQIIETTKNIIISDCYNANPTSMSNAIISLKNTFPDRKLCVILGDMLELGADSEDEHKQILNTLQHLKIDFSILVGNEYMKLKKYDNFKFYNSVDDLKNSTVLHQLENCVVLVKGSRGIGLDKILQEIS